MTEKFLIFGLFLASWTIIACQAIAQSPRDSDFSRAEILNQIQNHRVDEHLNEVRTVISNKQTKPLHILLPFDTFFYISFSGNAVSSHFLGKKQNLLILR